MQLLRVAQHHQRLIRRRADKLARPHVHLQHPAGDEGPHHEPLEVDLDPAGLRLGPPEGSAGNIAIVLPRACFEQVEIGLAPGEPRLRRRKSLPSLDELLLRRNLSGKGFLDPLQGISLPHHSGFGLRDRSQQHRNLLLPRLGLQPHQGTLRLRHGRLTHDQRPSKIAVVEPKERRTDGDFVTNLDHHPHHDPGCLGADRDVLGLSLDDTGRRKRFGIRTGSRSDQRRGILADRPRRPGIPTGEGQKPQRHHRQHLLREHVAEGAGSNEASRLGRTGGHRRNVPLVVGGRRRGFVSRPRQPRIASRRRPPRSGRLPSTRSDRRRSRPGHRASPRSPPCQAARRPRGSGPS